MGSGVLGFRVLGFRVWGLGVLVEGFPGDPKTCRFRGSTL